MRITAIERPFYFRCIFCLLRSHRLCINVNLVRVGEFVRVYVCSVFSHYNIPLIVFWYVLTFMYLSPENDSKKKEK